MHQPRWLIEHGSNKLESELLKDSLRGTIIGMVPGIDFREPRFMPRIFEHAARRFIDFFTSNIRNRNTREAYRRAVNEFLAWCEAHGVAVVAYSPFGHNDFPSPRSKAGEVLRTIADAHGASPRQVALSFLTRNPAVFAIPKAASAEHAATIMNSDAPRIDRVRRIRSPRVEAQEKP